MAPSKVWNIELPVADGKAVKIPILGLGTYKALGDEIKKSVLDAIDIGYRHFDTADYYQNLEPIGEALREAIAAGKVTREEIFLTTKIWPTYYGKGRVEASVRKQLKLSGLEYFDLVLLHWPVVFADEDSLDFPVDEQGLIRLADDKRSLNEIYAELEQTYRQGLTRSIGISNFNRAQVEQILKTATIKPVTNQVEANVYLQQRKLQKFCAEHNIILTGYCPLGTGGNRPNTKNPLEEQILIDIGAKYGKTSAQVSLRFLIQRGIVAIPKSVRRERLQANFDIFDFELSAEDLSLIETLDCGRRCVWFDIHGLKRSVNFPFDAEY